MGAKFLTSGTVYATAVADFHSSVQAVSISVATVEEVIPPLDAGGIEMTFTINCPYSSAASMGAALVPENLFPVDKEAHRRLLAGRLRAAARGVCDAPQSRWKQRASRSNIRTGTVFRLSL